MLRLVLIILFVKLALFVEIEQLESTMVQTVVTAVKVFSEEVLEKIININAGSFYSLPLISFFVAIIFEKK